MTPSETAERLREILTEAHRDYDFKGIVGDGYEKLRASIEKLATEFEAIPDREERLLPPEGDMIRYGVVDLRGIELSLGLGKIEFAPIDYASKCKRRRTDGPTSCLCCQGECVG